MTDSRPIAGISVPYRVRFDEADADGRVRMSTLLRYAADAGWLHSEQLGYPRSWYEARGLAWVVRSAEITVLESIGVGATLSVGTAIAGFRKVWARRRSEARTAEGALAWWGHTDYVMLGPGGMPGRVPPEFPAAFAAPPASFDPVKVTLPAPPTSATRVPVLVRPQDIDPMGHVNNAVYLDYVEAAITVANGAVDVAGLPRRVALEYVTAVPPGAALVAVAWQADGAGTADGTGTADRAGTWYCRIDDADGRTVCRAVSEPAPA